MNELQHHSDRMFESAHGQFVAKVAELQADKEMLQARFRLPVPPVFAEFACPPVALPS